MSVPPPKTHSSRRGEIIRYLVFHTIGNFLVLMSIFGFIAVFGPIAFYEIQYGAAKIFQVHYSVADTKQTQGPTELGKLLTQMQETPEARQSLFGTIVSGKKEQLLIPDSAQFSVIIPKIGAHAPITQNVDPNDEQGYLRVLQNSVAHAKGSALPGLKGSTYLFAHSADSFWNVGRYNAVFYLLNKMEVGDDVIIFYSGQRYDYVVKKTEIVEAEDTHYIASNIGQGEKIILQTCWPPGTAWKRFLVFAEPK